MPSRRAYENTRSSSVARPAPPRTKKKRSRIPEHNDLTPNDLSDLEPKQRVSRKPSKSQEPLPTKYTLYIKVLVDDVDIYSRTRLQTAGAFDYAGFMSVEAQKTSEYCARLERDAVTRTSRAKIVYNKKEYFQSDIDSLEDWRLLDELAGTYLQDKSKKDVQLSWVITHRLKALSVEPEKEALEPFEDESEDDPKDYDEEAESARPSEKVGFFEAFWITICRYTHYQ